MHFLAQYAKKAKYQEQHAALEVMLKGVQHYSGKLVKVLPIRDAQHRSRFYQAMSTLFTAYAAAIYFGAKPPALRQELLPNLWRLYRAAHKPLRE